MSKPAAAISGIPERPHRSAHHGLPRQHQPQRPAGRDEGLGDLPHRCRKGVILW